MNYASTYHVGDISVSDDPDEFGMYQAYDGFYWGFSRTKFGALAHVLQQKADEQLRRHLEARREAANSGR